MASGGGAGILACARVRAEDYTPDITKVKFHQKASYLTRLELLFKRFCFHHNISFTTYIYIYTYRERERYRYKCVCIYIYIVYIYIYMSLPGEPVPPGGQRGRRQHLHRGGFRDDDSNKPTPKTPSVYIAISGYHCYIRYILLYPL